VPVWEAEYVVVIAARTGWTEEFIRWELPLCRGWAYYHAAMLMDGQRMRWPGSGDRVVKWFRSVQGWLGKLRK